MLLQALLYAFIHTLATVVLRLLNTENPPKSLPESGLTNLQSKGGQATDFPVSRAAKRLPFSLYCSFLVILIGTARKVTSWHHRVLASWDTNPGGPAWVTYSMSCTNAVPRFSDQYTAC